MLTKTDLHEISKIVKASELRLDKKIHTVEQKLDYAINWFQKRS